MTIGNVKNPLGIDSTGFPDRLVTLQAGWQTKVNFQSKYTDIKEEGECLTSSV